MSIRALTQESGETLLPDVAKDLLSIADLGGLAGRAEQLCDANKAVTTIESPLYPSKVVVDQFGFWASRTDHMNGRCSESGKRALRTHELFVRQGLLRGETIAQPPRGNTTHNRVRLDGPSDYSSCCHDAASAEGYTL